MFNNDSYLLGVHRNCIRELFEFGRQRAKVVGAENVFDYSLGNPSIPAPPEVNAAIHAILEEVQAPCGKLLSRNCLAESPLR